jgi:hypothetical protein
MKVPKILYKAQRQYRHNIGDDTLISGFDFEETIKIVNGLLERSDNSDYEGDKLLKLPSCCAKTKDLCNKWDWGLKYCPVCGNELGNFA